MRTTEAVDTDLRMEWRILVIERRAGRDTNATRACWVRIDRLLDERLTIPLHPRRAPGVPAHFTP